MTRLTCWCLPGNMFTILHANISTKHKGQLRLMGRWLLKSLQFILRGTWMSEPNFRKIHPIVAEIFQSGPKWLTNWRCHHRSHVTSMTKKYKQMRKSWIRMIDLLMHCHYQAFQSVWWMTRWRCRNWSTLRLPSAINQSLGSYLAPHPVRQTGCTSMQLDYITLTLQSRHLIDTV